tara:strand:- start:55427 stop:57220 length:1794 start_codon:yes stop_codon:yes gene_type:complete
MKNKNGQENDEISELLEGVAVSLKDLFTIILPDYWRRHGAFLGWRLGLPSVFVLGFTLICLALVYLSYLEQFESTKIWTKVLPLGIAFFDSIGVSVSYYWLYLSGTLFSFFVLAYLSPLLVFTFYYWFTSDSDSKGTNTIEWLGRGLKLTKNGPNFGQKKVRNSLGSNNQLIIGQPGKGKSDSVLLPQIRKAIFDGETVFSLDFKGEKTALNHVANFCREAGRLENFYYLSISEDDINISRKISLFKGSDPNVCKDAIITSTEHSEPYYKKLAEVEMMKVFKKLGDDATISKVHSSIPNKKDLMGIKNDLEKIMMSSFGALFDDPNAPSFSDLYDENAVVHISFNSQSYPEASFQLGKIILSGIMNLSNKIQSKIPEGSRKKSTVAIDEFGTFLNEPFISFISKCRSSKMKALLATQSFADLKKDRPEMLDRILDNIPNIVVLGTTSETSTEGASKLFGTKTSTKLTSQVEEGLLVGKKETGMHSLREVEEFIVHPNMIRSLKKGKGYIRTSEPNAIFETTFSAKHLKMSPFDYESFREKELEDIKRSIPFEDLPELEKKAFLNRYQDGYEVYKMWNGSPEATNDNEKNDPDIDTLI